MTHCERMTARLCVSMSASVFVHQVENQLNEMFYGCAPFKMKTCILVGSPLWMNWLIAIMRMFISKKMSERIINTDAAGLQTKVGGPEYLPQGRHVQIAC